MIGLDDEDDDDDDDNGGVSSSEYLRAGEKEEDALWGCAALRSGGAGHRSGGS